MKICGMAQNMKGKGQRGPRMIERDGLGFTRSFLSVPKFLSGLRVRMSRRTKSVTVLTGNQKKLFNDALDLYDRKQYNRALQYTKRIQKASPDNGESFALEGLIRHSLGDKTDGYALVKKGLGISLRYPKGKKEISLPFCFRAYALIYQSDLNFEKCSASFHNALRFDPENKHVLRDLAHAQTILEDWNGLVNTLRKLIKIDLSETNNWLALSLAYHQSGSYSSAVSVIDKWILQTERELRETREKHEKNDLFYKKKRVEIYRINILFEMKKYERAKTEILKLQRQSKDPDLEILLGRVCLELGEKEKAKEIIFKQLVFSPEDHELIRLYQKIVFRLDDEDILKEGVYNDPEDIRTLIEIYDDLASKIPKVLTINRIPLTLSNGEEFKRRFFEFVKPMLTRTVPSLFESVKSLYTNPVKIAQIEKIFLEITSSLEEKSEYPKLFSTTTTEGEDEDETEGEGDEEGKKNNNNDDNDNDNNNREAPSTVLFSYLFLAKHYDRIEEHEKGLEYIEKGISHTPTLCELYMTKAKILKHLGRPTDASLAMELSRKLDLADRFLNTLSTEYLLLDQKVEEAYRVSFLFSVDHEGVFNLHAQQGILFEMNLGASYRRMGRLCLALHEFDRVREYFLNTRKNMNSFHDYFLKKCSVMEYMDMVKYVRGIKHEKLYLEATAEAVELFLMFHNNPGLAEYRYKITREEKKKWRITQKDKDRMDFLFGEYVNNSKEGYLNRALEYIRDLEKYRNDDFKTQDLAMEVYTRMKKHMLLLRALKLGIQIIQKKKEKKKKKKKGEEDENLERCKKAFEILKLMEVPEKMSDVSKNVLQEEIKELEVYFSEK